MRGAVVGLLVGVLAFILFGSCGPSEVEEGQESIREQRRLAADEAAAEKRLEEQEQERVSAAVASFREWLLHLDRSSGRELPKYNEVVTRVVCEGATLTLELSPAAGGEALELCRLALTGWGGRETHGVFDIQVLSAADGAMLARSSRLSTGQQVCQ